MIIYMILLVASAGFALSYMDSDSVRTQIEPIRRLLGFFFILALIGLYIWRGNTVGTDYPMYNMFLAQPSTYLEGVGVESGYVWLYGIAAAKQWPLFVTTVSSLMTLVGLYLFALRVKVATPMFASMDVLTYVYLSSFNLVRQMAAMGICFTGLALFTPEDEKTPFQWHFWWRYVIYVILVVIAMRFHSSVVIALVLPFCMYIKVKPWMAWTGLVLTTVGFVFELGNRLVPILSRFFPHYLAKYSGDMSAFLETGTKGLIAFIPVLIQFLIIIAIIHYDPDFVESHQWLTALYLIFLTWFVMAGNQAAIRAQDCWLPAGIYFFGRYLQVGQAPIGRLSPNFMKLFIVMFFFLYTVLRIVTNNSGIYPYIFR
ncbi:EpsG family protein [Lacticaseibacillus paracasei]|uniref:EpsG family protein n=1 Tax=Lacticaseibacillus paracasei TaxID=1597 RepID=UPI002A5A9CD6|nr:EpsG family protein [Lacticaseibacillus paracasei]MDY0839809.1 EpsG family protein [Lacticaseibacillus paracasei]